VTFKTKIPVWVGILAAVVTFLGVWEITYFPKMRAMEGARVRVVELRSEWNEFRNEVPGCELLQMRAHTSPIGSIRISGVVPSAEAKVKVIKFTEGIHWDKGVSAEFVSVDLERYQKFKKRVSSELDRRED